MKKILSLLITTLFSLAAFANPDNVEMADTLRASGKIYVVVAVIAVVFIGLFVYLYTIDRKISKIEKDK